jgi:hypothetical protein
MYGFFIENKKLVYQHVFETNLETMDDLKGRVELSLTLDEYFFGDSIISGIFKKIDPMEFMEELGIGLFKTPSKTNYWLLMGHIDIQFKKGRYRITLRDIELELQRRMIVGLSIEEKGAVFELNQFCLDKSKAQVWKWCPKTFAVYDYAFQKTFKYETEDEVLYDDFRFLNI